MASSLNWNTGHTRIGKSQVFSFQINVSSLILKQMHPI